MPPTHVISHAQIDFLTVGSRMSF